MVAVACRIAPLQLGVYQTLPDGLFGYFLIILPLFLLPFADHTNGFMIDHGKDSLVSRRQFPVAPLALDSTRQFFRPGIRHFAVLLYFKIDIKVSKIAIMKNQPRTSES
jgi:hypothetical protein